MFKCIECDAPAEYIYKGNSVCKEHLEYASQDGKVNESKYLVLLKDYIGRKPVLDYFWSRCLQRYPNVSFNEKSKWLRRINKIVLDFKIDAKILDAGINIAIKKTNFDIGFLIQLIKNNQGAIDKKNANNNINEDVYAQIVNNT